MGDHGSARRLLILGSTGSIGVNTLEVVEHLRARRIAELPIVALAAGRNAELLAEQAARFDVHHLALAAEDVPLPAALEQREVARGGNAARKLVEAHAQRGDMLVGAMVGAAGVPATLAAIERGCDIALANKETLVAAGAVVMPKAREAGVELLPVDSEHSAIAQCLRSGRSVDEIERLVLTASGGPFRAWSRSRIEEATVAEALDHPTWSMGPKITIDSASLMNKALEVIEAHWLFGLESDRIEVVVHPQSIIHSMVEFVDGSVIAQLGPPDMRTPIQYALTWPHRHTGCSRRMAWNERCTMDFEPVDHDRFPALRLARRVIDEGGTAGAVFNAANETAVEAFLAERISFGRITQLVAAALDAIPVEAMRSLDDFTRADARARAFVRESLDESRDALAAAASRLDATEP